MLPIFPSSSKQLPNVFEASRTQKKPSSVRFRIEHLLPSDAIVPNLLERNTFGITHQVQSLSEYLQIPKKARNPHSGIIASQNIGKDSRSEGFCTTNLISSPLFMSNQKDDIVEYCDMDSKGYIRCVTSSSWIRKIKFSEDVHSYNCVIERSCDSVSIRAIKEITRGEELVAWFSEEVLILMAIPFLTPANIQG